MRILFLVHAFNSLAQRLYVELAEAGHEVSIEFDVNDRVTDEAVAAWRPDLIVAPFLKRRIPESVWRQHRCIVIHPGIPGDRGPSALDWAISNQEPTWGVTALEATAELDGGPVWASVEFPMRSATKSSLYRNEVTEAAVVAIRQLLDRLGEPGFQPRTLAPSAAGCRGRMRPLMRQIDRAIDWARDDTATILCKIRAADGSPGVQDDLCGVPVRLFGAHAEGTLRRTSVAASPGSIIATRDIAICRASRDAAVWITHVQRAGGFPHPFKLPATMALADMLTDVAEAPLAADAPDDTPTWRPLCYDEQGGVGFLHFPFYNGAMGTRQCEQLRSALVHAKGRPTRVIVLYGGPDFWSNGLDLNVIEAAAQPAAESWLNITAMNDLVREILLTPAQVTVAALQGNAGAGGVFLALAADHVFARTGAILNPHYRGMGNLYGSEYWTYLLPRRVGSACADTITASRLPLSAGHACSLRLIDDCFGTSAASFRSEVARRAAAFADDPGRDRWLVAKAAARAADEAARPLESYRADELAQMRLNFFGFDPSYHVARSHFVRKLPRSRTPLHLARHRALRARLGGVD